jgi:hypothetical protein
VGQSSTSQAESSNDGVFSVAVADGVSPALTSTTTMSTLFSWTIDEIALPLSLWLIEKNYFIINLFLDII